MNQEHHHEPKTPTNQAPMGQGKSGQPVVAKWLWITLIIVAVFGGFFTAWYLLMGPGKTPVATTTTPTTTTDVTANWKTYTDTVNGFSFKYPSDWVTDTADKTIVPSGMVKLSSPATITKEKANTGPNPVGPDLEVNGYANFTAFNAINTPPLKVSDVDGWLSYTKAQNITKTTNSNGVAITEAAMQADPSYSTAIATNASGNIVVFNFNSGVTALLDTTKSLTSLTDTSKKILSTFKFTTAAAATTGTTATPATTTDLTYTNPAYGFTLTFPATWKGYKIKEAVFEGSSQAYYISIPTTDSSFKGDTTADAGYYSPFVISVYTLDQWQTAQAAEGPKDTLIKQNDKYVFAWSQANGMQPSDWTKSADVKTIIASLKLN